MRKNLLKKILFVTTVVVSILTVVRVGGAFMEAVKASNVSVEAEVEENYASQYSESYTVKAGDSVTSIARGFIEKYNLKESEANMVARIQSDNNLDNYHLGIGQTISVRYWK